MTDLRVLEGAGEILDGNHRLGAVRYRIEKLHEEEERWSGTLDIDPVMGVALYAKDANLRLRLQDGNWVACVISSVDGFTVKIETTGPIQRQ